MGLGWITYTPGYRRQDGSFERTKYHDAEYAKVQRGKPCGALNRDTWRTLIEFLKKRRLDHASLVAVALLSYFWKIIGGREMGSTIIPKAKITATGMTSKAFARAITEVTEVLPDLFTVRETHHAFEIAEWKGGPDAS